MPGAPSSVLVPTANILYYEVENILHMGEGGALPWYDQCVTLLHLFGQVKCIFRLVQCWETCGQDLVHADRTRHIRREKTRSR